MELPPRISSNYERKLLTGGEKRVSDLDGWFPTWLVTISDLAGDQRVAVFLTWLVGEKQVSDLPGDKWVAVSDLVDDKRASDLAGNFF